MEHRPSATTVTMTPTWGMREVMGAAMEASASQRLTPTRAPVLQQGCVALSAMVASEL